MPTHKPGGGRRRERKAPAKQTVPKRTADLTKSAPTPRARSKPGPKGLDWRPAYLAALAETGMVSSAAEAAEVTPSAVYQERRKNAGFAEVEREALAVAAEMLRDEAVRRARHGLVRYRFGKDGAPLLHPVTGEPYYELEYSDNLLALLLRGLMPETFRENVKLEHSGKVQTRHMTLAEFDERMKEARA